MVKYVDVWDGSECDVPDDLVVIASARARLLERGLMIGYHQLYGWKILDPANPDHQPIIGMFNPRV